jgi:peptide/nickel transport system permease protein
MGFAATVTLGLAGLFALAWAIRAGGRVVLTGQSRSLFNDMPLTAAFGLLVIAIYAFVALAAPVLAPFPEREIVGTQFAAWSADHPLGTDRIGRDMLRG